VNILEDQHVAHRVVAGANPRPERALLMNGRRCKRRRDRYVFGWRHAGDQDVGGAARDSNAIRAVTARTVRVPRQQETRLPFSCVASVDPNPMHTFA
jgi:hypothetical protein